MKEIIRIAVAGLMLGCLTMTVFAGQPNIVFIMSDDHAWAEVKAAAEPPAQPAAWRQNRPSKEEFKAWTEKANGSLLVAADTAGEFIAKFPKSEHVPDARKQQISSLATAAMNGNKERQTELTKLVDAAAADLSIPEDERVGYCIQRASVRAMPLFQTDQKKGQKALIDGMIALQQEYPKNDKVCSALMTLAMGVGGDETVRIAKIIAGTPDAPAKLKAKAQDIVDSKVFIDSMEIGKPVPIKKFTAVDGREVDLASMKGKVVLLDFWATWCSPCVAEIPHLKEAYQKYHDQGFEIIGISYDREGDKEKLIKFTKDKGMPWPQYFDGKAEENKYGKMFNIRGIPTMWLIGKDGNLADINARRDLAGKVGKLLQAK